MTSSQSKNNNMPMRRCIGCMESKDKKTLLRIICTPTGEILPDPSGRAPGRGAYICRDDKCFAKATKKRAFDRAFKKSFIEGDLEPIRREVNEEE